MNKTIQTLSIFSAVLMFGGVAAAGNLTDIKQIGGTADFASTKQSGNDQEFYSVQKSNSTKNSMTNTQAGFSNFSKMEQTATAAGPNTGINNQNGKHNHARTIQTTTGSSTIFSTMATVKQTGDSNSIGGSDSSGVIGSSATKATQTSTIQSSIHSWQRLNFSQSGNNNKIGLSQTAILNNDATVIQSNGGNSLGAYQTATWNKLNVNQNGGDSATVVQTNTSTNPSIGNRATIDQR